MTKNGKPAGVLVGVASKDDWFEYNYNMTRLLAADGDARQNLQAEKGVKLEYLKS